MSTVTHQRRAALLIVAVILVALAWGGAAALAWSEWNSSSTWWKGETVVGDASLRAADRRLFLEDALAVTALVLVVAVALVLVARRDRGTGVVLAWAVVGLGVLLWLIGPLSAPRIDDASIRCTNLAHARNEEAAGSLAIRGWSWTRFSEIVVRTDPSGSRETSCP